MSRQTGAWRRALTKQVNQQVKPAPEWLPGPSVPGSTLSWKNQRCSPLQRGWPISGSKDSAWDTRLALIVDQTLPGCWLPRWIFAPPLATLARAGAGDTRCLMSEICREPTGLGGCVLGIKYFSSNYYRRQGPRWPLRALGRPFEPEEAWMTEGPRRGSSTLRNRHSPQSHFHPTGSSLPGGGIDPSRRPAGQTLWGRSLAVTLGG